MSRMKDHWDPVAHARRTDPGTSHEAAAKVTKKLTSIQQSVLSLFEVRREMTDIDLQAYFGSAGATYRTRRKELVVMGKLRNSGRKRAQDGSNRIIWEIVP